MEVERLNQEAYSIENELEKKIESFSHMVIIVGETMNLSQNECNNIQLDIENLLNKLRSSVERMGQVLSESNKFDSYNNSNLQRHREVLYDFTQEFIKLKGQVVSSRERYVLFEGLKDDDSGKETDTAKTSLLLREREHILNSNRLTESTIAQAHLFRERLSGQNKDVGDSKATLSSMTSRFPVIDSFLSGIDSRRRRDTVIVGIFISICLIIMFLLWNR